MLFLTILLAALAGLLHAYIFWMESLAWTSLRVRRTFGTSAEEAEATREMAFNQGFYNLFLGLAAVAGSVLLALDSDGPAGLGEGRLSLVGCTLVGVSLGSMLLAALVLFCSSPDKRRAALSQGILPLLGLACLGLT